MSLTKIGTPDRLVRAAQEELVESHGLLEMQAVAKRAKVSVGLAYHHFGSKAGLIAAVVEGFYNRLEEVAFSPSKLSSPDWAGREKERIAAYRESGVTVLNVTPVGPDPIAILSQLREWI